MTRRSAATALACAALTLSACGNSDPYYDFTDAIEDGATCAELFEIRNEWDPDSSDIEKANVELQKIGCYSSSSDRTD